MRSRAVLIGAIALVVRATTVAAQCADGSTPANCRATTPAHRDPPLDERTWIVIPFTNVAHVTDVDWLSGASVSLLSVDMLRWSDLHVVDNERVTDLLRDVAEAGRTQLGLKRAWLLYADLAIATGHRDQARRGYTMIVGMWERGDPRVQPLVKRAREALARLGG